jgi:hypothetical protein
MSNRKNSISKETCVFASVGRSTPILGILLGLAWALPRSMCSLGASFKGDARLLALMVIMLSSSVAKAEFTATYSVNSSTIQKIEEWVDKHTIVFIEIDDTLIMPKSLMFSFDSNPYRLFIDNLISLGTRMPAYNSSVASWYQQRQVKLVESGWVDFINRLKEKGVTVYGICSMPLHLLNIEEKRYIEVKDLGITFSNSINKQEDFVIEKKEAWFSRFYKGIVFTGPYSKSHTLIEFLRITNVPSKMLVISSINQEVKAIDSELRVFNMDYYSVHYLGAREVRGKPDEQLVKLQQQELIQNGKWLEDDAAKLLLQSLKPE